MGSVTYYRAVYEYLAKNVSYQGFERLSDAEFENPKLSIAQSKGRYVYKDFEEWWKKSGKDGILACHHEKKDMGYEYFSNEYGGRIKEILGLADEGIFNLSEKDKKSFVLSASEVFLKDSYRAMFFFLFSFFQNNIHSDQVYVPLHDMKPDDGSYPNCYLFYSNKKPEDLTLDDDGFTNVSAFLKENYSNLYVTWEKVMTKELFSYVMNNPLLYEDYQEGVLKVLTIPLLGMTLTREKRPSIFWDSIMSIIMGHTLIIKDKTNIWEIYFNEEGFFHIGNGKSINFENNALSSFLSVPFKGRTVNDIIKQSKETKIFTRQ